MYCCKRDDSCYKKLTFKNNTVFRSYISKINRAFTDNAKDLDIVMCMYNLLEYSDNYSATPGNLRWDEVNSDAIENNATNYRKNYLKQHQVSTYFFFIKNPFLTLTPKIV